MPSNRTYCNMNMVIVFGILKDLVPFVCSPIFNCFCKLFLQGFGRTSEETFYGCHRFETHFCFAVHHFARRRTKIAWFWGFWPYGQKFRPKCWFSRFFSKFVEIMAKPCEISCYWVRGRDLEVLRRRPFGTLECLQQMLRIVKKCPQKKGFFELVPHVHLSISSPHFSRLHENIPQAPKIFLTTFKYS